ncbi:5-carboxymethyl-2-hydroxymuconate delta-isomerase [Salmonella enterica subsp. enterica]|nr:5-carboxymethyl-2-hydroxymuconate delta-isomerase [Salmonella enterica subsp. enterica]
MPHFIAECTENIRESRFTAQQSKRGAGSPAGFSPSAVSAVAPTLADTRQMADGKHDYAFVHMTLKIGAGRSSWRAVRKLAKCCFGLIKAHSLPT